MPYYLYKIHGPRTVEAIEAHDVYREARNRARALRADQALADSSHIRLVFAKSPEEAEKLLLEVREPRPLGEDA